MKLRWRFGIFAGIVLAILMLYPQLRMVYLRGQQWEGNYAISDVDEVAYAAYLQSLIEGKPRKNDSYTKLNDTSETPLPESLFSIQFASAYAVAIPARILGGSASAAMTITGVLSASLSALAVFWLIGMVTDDSLYALAGTLVIFCGGALAGGEGAILDIVGSRVAGPFFPGFRRYTPAVALPLLFGFCGLLWFLVRAQDNKRRLFYGILAFFCFGFTVYSYFYVWTTLAAWLVCVSSLWLIARPEGWAKDSRAFLMLGVGCLLWLPPYKILLANRASTTDDVQLLELSHSPDFARFPEYIGIAVLIVLVVGILRKTIKLREPVTLFAAAFALVPLVVHNQQIITGNSLQPVHYDLFTVNYLAMLAMVLAVWQSLKSVVSFHAGSARIVILTVCIVAFVWGLVECHLTARVYDGINIERDKGLKVAKHLREIGVDKRSDRNTVLSTSIWLGDDLPTFAPQPILWALHQIAFGGITTQESKERYYQFLYYQNVNGSQLTDEIRDNNFSPIIALFGSGRYSSRLSSTYKPVTDVEISHEAALYKAYVLAFDPWQSSQTILGYVIVPNNTIRLVDLSNMDRWYEREATEIVGDYTLYKVKLKTFDAAKEAND